jgi:hypothetical protein
LFYERFTKSEAASEQAFSSLEADLLPAITEADLLVGIDLV